MKVNLQWQDESFSFLVRKGLLVSLDNDSAMPYDALIQDVKFNIQLDTNSHVGVFFVDERQNILHINLAGHYFRFALVAEGDLRDSLIRQGDVVAQLPGSILKVAVKEGDKVEKGQLLVVQEAMKMEHSIVAKAVGVVDKVLVKAGQQVAADALLIELKNA